jgi:hypothetical protein
MKHFKRYTYSLFLVANLFLLEVEGSVFADRSAREAKAVYELDVRRAKDMSAAFGQLSSMLDRDHYIRVVLTSSATGFTQGYGVSSCFAQGTLLTFKLVKLDDDREIKGLTIRAREVQRLELLERPW